MLRVKGEVAKKCKTLRLLRGERLPSIHTYDIISRIYENAKVKYIGYRKGSRKIAPATTVIRTIQAKINQTIALIERERRREGENRENRKQLKILMHRYLLLEKELYNQWEIEKQQKWSQWIKKLNSLDYKKATRIFYSEIRSKKMEVEHFGPIVDREGRLSTTLEESIENRRSYYAKLYSQQDKNLTTEV